MRAKTCYTRRRHHAKVIKAVRGYRMTRHRLFKVAHEALLHAGQYAFAGRHRRKREIRRLWTIRINAAVRQQGFSYSHFIKLMKDKNISINRKMLAHLAVKEPKKFVSLFQKIVGKTTEKKK